LRKEKNKCVKKGGKFMQKKKYIMSEQGEQVSILLNFNCVWLEEFEEEGDLDSSVFFLPPSVVK
jgi:hypothetical protein